MSSLSKGAIQTHIHPDISSWNYRRLELSNYFLSALLLPDFEELGLKSLSIPCFTKLRKLLELNRASRFEHLKKALVCYPFMRFKNLAVLYQPCESHLIQLVFFECNIYVLAQNVGTGLKMWEQSVLKQQHTVQIIEDCHENFLLCLRRLRYRFCISQEYVSRYRTSRQNILSLYANSLYSKK